MTGGQAAEDVILDLRSRQLFTGSGLDPGSSAGRGGHARYKLKGDDIRCDELTWKSVRPRMLDWRSGCGGRDPRPKVEAVVYRIWAGSRLDQLVGDKARTCLNGCRTDVVYERHWNAHATGQGNGTQTYYRSSNPLYSIPRGVVPEVTKR